MKKIVVGLLAIAVLVLAAFFVFFFCQNEWKTYENSRYQFNVDYPSDWALGEAPINNDGREFISPDDGITCRAYGFANALTGKSGEPQTLDEFVDWLIEDLVPGSLLEKQKTIIDGKDACKIISINDGILSKAAYTLGKETGIGLVCFYPSKEKMKASDKDFEAMRKSLKIDVSLDGSVNMNECVNLLNGVLVPFKDFQTFKDTKYTEVTLISREAWDKSKLPAQVISLESKGYTCFPMPSEFDYSEPDGAVMAEPAVTEVEWTCQLEYDEWKYLDGNDTVGKQVAEKEGFNCEREQCLTNEPNIDDIGVWLCSK